jgi:ribosomal-protein-alanine N-acetyltransferase
VWRLSRRTDVVNTLLHVERMSYYFVEPMTEADIDQVQQVESQSFSTPWSAATYRRELRNQSSCRYVVARSSDEPPPPRTAHADGRSSWLGQLLATFLPQQHQRNAGPIVGYGGLWLMVDDAHITAIAVDPAHRGQGVGELLLNALIDGAFELEAKLLTLEVRVSNTAAQQLYVKYGFQPAGTRPRYYTDNGEDALIMWTDPINTPAYRERLSILRRRLVQRLQQDVASLPPLIDPQSPRADADGRSRMPSGS